ncbi:MAG: presenilin family intramembrane aspartyl protease [Candidatus Nanoarchaeia archaeon]
MKHNIKVTLILVSMFVLTQLIGLAVLSVYNSGLEVPYGMQPPEEIEQDTSLASILLSFAFAIGLLFLLTKIKAEKFLRLWFFLVTVLAIALALNAIFFKFNILYASIIALLISFPLAYMKIFKRNIIVHNVTEFLIYPGIAAVFVPLLGVYGIIILLLVISLYDIWAVWKSQFMQKMAKYQIDVLRIFTGFFVPYADKKEKMKLELIKEKYSSKGEKELDKQFKKSKIKIHLAILGGGDIIFPIIASGVFYKLFGLASALTITLFATLALSYLLTVSKKGKFYPAMPYLTIGIYLGMVISWLLF